MDLDKTAIENLEKQYRTTLINSVSGYRSVHLCATLGADGIPNLSVLNSVLHLGANPALLGMILRPRDARQHTLQNIEANGVYTLNQMQKSYAENVHRCSARYSENENEFLKAGLNALNLPDFAAPFVAESPIRYGLKLVEIVPISANGTFFIIGQIEHLHIQNELLEPNGYADLNRANILLVNGLDAYHTAKRVARFNYAKPNEPISNIL